MNVVVFSFVNLHWENIVLPTWNITVIKSEGTDVFLTKSSYKSRDFHMPKTLDKSKRKVIMAICVHWIVLVALVAWGAINVSERVNDWDGWKTSLVNWYSGPFFY